MLTYAELQAEVKRRATKDQAGTEFDSAIKNAINFSLFRIAREGAWRMLRRESSFDTETSYSTGSGAVSVTSGSKNFSVTGATFITDNIKVGRRIIFGTSSTYFTIKTITSETAGTIDMNYDGTTSTTTTYSILPTEEYNLPIQADHRTFLWHRAYGFPFQLQYVPEQEFRAMSIIDTNIATPIAYRMWTQNMAIEQPLEPSAITISSSDIDDTSINITIFGIVSGYPDSEIIPTNSANGTTAATGTKVFSSIDRAVKASETEGRITVTSNSTNTTVAVIPAGALTTGISYAKVLLYPLPDMVFPMYVTHYKVPYALVNDGDVSELGEEFDEAIILLSVSKIMFEDRKEEGDKFYAMYNDEVKSLRRTNVDKPDWFVKLSRPNSRGYANLRFQKNIWYNQLGGNYGPVSRYY